jgi:hypothetical protein
MGGIWLFVDARSPKEIAAKYPELRVYEEAPEFLDDDDPPRGFLAELVAARKGRG